MDALLSIYKDEIEEEEEEFQLVQELDTSSSSAVSTSSSSVVPTSSSSAVPTSSSSAVSTSSSSAASISSSLSSNSLTCEICESNGRLYRCPRCMIFTCSLKCCKQHKISKNCDGK